MNVSKMTSHQPGGHGDVIDAGRPIIGMRRDIRRGHGIVHHQHPRAQLVYAAQGVLEVITDEASWLVPSNQAVWVPGGLPHHVEARSDAEFLFLHIDPSVAGRYPSQCSVVDMSMLIKELINRVVDYGIDYPLDGAEARVVAVLLDQLDELKPSALVLPLAKDRRVLAVMDRLREAPAADIGLAEFASEVGASARTLARLFEKETGLTFGNWRKQLRLQLAVRYLSEGKPVTDVALSLGYQTPSAFVVMFRKALGCSPARYCREQGIAS